jgi:hypothetical protein
MEIIQPDPEGFAPRQVVEETCVRLLCLLGVGLGQVDEVGAVREDVAGGVVGVGFGEGEEFGGCGGGEGGG